MRRSPTEQSRGAEHGVLWQCVALAMQCNKRLGLNFELRSASTSNYECWTADCGPKWPRRLCVCRCAPSWCGTSRYDATELKSFERPLVELVTYPLSAPKVLVASKILQGLGEAGQASCKSIRNIRRAQLRARRACIAIRRIAAFPAASRSLRRRRDQQQEYKQ